VSTYPYEPDITCSIHEATSDFFELRESMQKRAQSVEINGFPLESQLVLYVDDGRLQFQK
jgi:hypothetical protein